MKIVLIIQIKMIKIKIKILKIKQKFVDYFLIKTLIEILSKIIRNFYVFSVGLDEIYYEIKNPKRFKLCIIFCIFMWMATIWHFLALISPSLWSLIDNPFIPDQPKLCVLILMLALFLGTFLKCDFLLGELNGYLEPLKIFHILRINVKLIHQLTDRNYKHLAYLTRIIMILFLNYAITFFSILIPVFMLLIAISSKRLYWWIHLILFTPIYVSMLIIMATSGCLCYIYFAYYKLRFDQLNDQIKAIIPNGKWKMIFIGKEKLLLQMIDQHNLLALEINKVNLLLRRSAAMIFVILALCKIVTLYLTIYLKHTLARIIILNGFLFLFIFGFGLTTLFSLQINSAKKSYKIIHSVVCKCKMRIQLRLKVN